MIIAVTVSGANVLSIVLYFQSQLFTVMLKKLFYFSLNDNNNYIPVNEAKTDPDQTKTFQHMQ